MKVRMYIVTYNNEYHLNQGLESLFAADLSLHELEVFIINNHSNFHLHDEFKDKVTVLHNVLRLDRSTGHTSRNWNQALMLGFEDLNNPACDIVICAQDDTFYHSNWLNLLMNRHLQLRLDFICIGVGDTLHSYTPTAVKKIGMWDERFSALCFMEHDYFIRAAMHLGNKASVTDAGHAKGLYSINPLPDAQQIIQQPQRNAEKLQLGQERGSMQNPFRELFKAKWGDYSEFTPSSQFINKPHPPGIPGYITYPYFERDVEDLNGKGFNLGSSWQPPGWIAPQRV